MADAVLKARLREERGKGAARRLRREGRIPAVVYGRGEETRAVSVDALEMENLFSGISVVNTIITLQIEGGKKRGVKALVREVQAHPYRAEVLHVDFYQIHAGERLDVEVPIRLTGIAEGVKEGGHMEQVLYDLPVRCLPDDIPSHLELDVSALEIGESLHVSDLAIPAEVETDMDGERTVCAVVAPSRALVEEEEEEEGEVPEVLEGVEGEVEPELIRRRREEEEEADTTEQG